MRPPYGPMHEKRRPVGATHALPCSASGGKSDRLLGFGTGPRREGILPTCPEGAP